MRSSRLLPIILCLAAAPLAAQLPPLGVPRGLVRIELFGSAATADRQWVNGQSTDLGGLTGPVFGSVQAPFLAEPEARIAALLGDPSYRTNLGASVGRAQARVTAGGLGLAVGLSNRLTLLVRVPIVESRTQANLAFAGTGAQDGTNLASPIVGTPAGQAAANGFFTAYDAALAALSGQITSGAYAGDPAKLALAQQTLADGTALRDGLRALVSDAATAVPFLPLASSGPGAQLAGRIAALQSTLATDLGVTGFTAAAPLPTAPAAGYEVPNYATAPDGPVGLGTFSPAKQLSLGDVEAGIALTLLDRWQESRGGLRLAAEVLGRFPTGRVARPNDPWAVATGDGQFDAEFRIALDVGGPRFGIRATGGYLRQFAGTVTERVAPPGTVFALPTLAAPLRVDPGNELGGAVTPFIRLAPRFALLGGAEIRHRGTDAASYASTPLPGVDASTVTLGTGGTRVSFVGGLTYRTAGTRTGDRRTLPFDAGWYYEKVLDGRGGRVVRWETVRFLVRLYAQLW